MPIRRMPVLWVAAQKYIGLKKRENCKQDIPKNETNWDGNRFGKSRLEELQRLMGNGTFEVVDKATIFENTRSFSSHFVDTVNLIENGVRYKGV